MLYGLDYRTAAWRGDEVDPFHTEVGYWLGTRAQQVMRCFMVPRGQSPWPSARRPPTPANSL